jgi:GxxExxY protein
MKQEDALSKKIIACALEVHRILGGPGLLESIYEEALGYDLPSRRWMCRGRCRFLCTTRE